MGADFDLGVGWALAPGVALRDEDFGALAYDAATGRVSVLRTAALVALVRALADSPTAAQALGAVADDGSRAALAGALGTLARQGVLRAR